MNHFIKKYKKETALAIGVLLFVLMFSINLFSLMPKANLVLSIGILMISWWVLEALPLAVVALLPIVLFPNWYKHH